MKIYLISLLCCCRECQSPSIQIPTNLFFSLFLHDLTFWQHEGQLGTSLPWFCFALELAEEDHRQVPDPELRWCRAFVQEVWCLMSVSCCCLSIQTTLSGTGGRRHSPAGNTAKQIHCHGDCMTVGLSLSVNVSLESVNAFLVFFNRKIYDMFTSAM